VCQDVQLQANETWSDGGPPTSRVFLQREGGGERNAQLNREREEGVRGNTEGRERDGGREGEREMERDGELKEAEGKLDAARLKEAENLKEVKEDYGDHIRSRTPSPSIPQRFVTRGMPARESCSIWTRWAERSIMYDDVTSDFYGPFPIVFFDLANNLSYRTAKSGRSKGQKITQFLCGKLNFFAW